MDSHSLFDHQVIYYPGFLAAEDAAACYQCLKTKLQWRQEKIRMFGREILQPRLQAWYGDSEAQYRYSGLSMQPKPWTPELAQLRQQLEAFTGRPFNSVLANLYRDGQDYMGWHADDEKELGAEPVIASISLGASRSFRFKHRQHQGCSKTLQLHEGDLLLMQGRCQQHWLHCLPKRLRVKTARINLTFRYIHAADS